MNEEEIKARIEDIERRMNTDMNFWSDSQRAQNEIKELRNLKDRLDGEKLLDRGGCTMSILAGAGGDDSEDWARILMSMYQKYCDNNGWSYKTLHENVNDHGGYRNITIEISSKGDIGPYGKLKNENGVHRLVRISPFNANDKRHTSFALVEVLPILPEIHKVPLTEDELEISFANAGGPGGQNVNKRETKVIVKHKPTGIMVTVATERNQEQNRNIALELLQSKLYKLREEERRAQIEGRQISKTTEIEWGNQIRNYVLHPYKLIKDLRSGYETSDIDSILEKGELEDLISSLIATSKDKKVNWVKDLHSLRDFLALVIVYAPDTFPKEDYLADGQQLDLEMAFAELREGLKYIKPELKNNISTQDIGMEFSKAYNLYKSNKSIDAAIILQNIDDKLKAWDNKVEIE